jgi:hypothetical protein
MQNPGMHGPLHYFPCRSNLIGELSDGIPRLQPCLTGRGECGNGTFPAQTIGTSLGPRFDMFPKLHSLLFPEACRNILIPAPPSPISLGMVTAAFLEPRLAAITQTVAPSRWNIVFYQFKSAQGVFLFLEVAFDGEGRRLSVLSICVEYAILGFRIDGR